MGLGDVTFAALAVNPVGGLLVAVPWGALLMHYPAWLIILVGPPCAYLQVVIIDFGFDQLCRLAWFRNLLERRRSPRLERLMSSGGAFAPTFLLAPLVGPWLVMACMRFVRVPQRVVALPIYLGLTCLTALLTTACVWAPQWFAN